MTSGRPRPVGLGQGQVGLEDEAGVEDRLDVAVGVEVEVGAGDGEPHLGGPGVVVGHDQGVDRTGRLVEVGPGPIDLWVLGVLPGAALGERVDGAGVLVALDARPGREPVADHPEPLVDVDLDHLELDAVAGIDVGAFVLAPVDGLWGSLDDGHAPHQSTSRGEGHSPGPEPLR